MPVLESLLGVLLRLSRDPSADPELQMAARDEYVAPAGRYGAGRP